MAYIYSVNNAPATGAVAVYQLIAQLVAAGWIKKMDSDGTVYSATGVQVTSGASGSGGLGNNSAWIRIQAPALNNGATVNQTREFTFQRGTSDLLWRIKYSSTAGFTGGAPAATVTSSSTDEVFMAGGGTDAAPTFYSWFQTNATYRWHMITGGAAEFYSFIAFATGTAALAGTQFNAIFVDSLTAGSFPAANDIDPAVVYVSTAAGTLFEIVSSALPTVNITNPALARAWLGATSAAGAAITGTNSQNVKCIAYGSSSIGFGSQSPAGVNPWTRRDDLFPVVYACKTAAGPKGIKGFSTLFQMGSVYRDYQATLDVVTVRDRIFIGTLWLPWSGARPKY